MIFVQIELIGYVYDSSTDNAIIAESIFDYSWGIIDGLRLETILIRKKHSDLMKLEVKRKVSNRKRTRWNLIVSPTVLKRFMDSNKEVIHFTNGFVSN